MCDFIFVKDLIIRKSEIVYIQNLGDKVCCTLRDGTKWSITNKRDENDVFDDICFQLIQVSGGNDG